MTEGLVPTVRAFAAGLPEAWEDHPWGESVFKVGKKVFVFFGVLDTDAGLRFTVKLRDSHEEAMSMSWVVPAGYGLDRGGWVTAVAPDDTPVESSPAGSRRATGSSPRSGSWHGSIPTAEHTPRGEIHRSRGTDVLARASRGG